jgi:AcrR family transcriptional regulator
MPFDAFLRMRKERMTISAADPIPADEPTSSPEAGTAAVGVATALDARTRILDASEKLFAADGFDATSTARVAKSAGVPKGLVFYYFPAKLDVLIALVNERLGTGFADPETLAVPGNPAQALLNVADRLDDLRSKSSTLATIIWREQGKHPQIGAALAAHRRALRETIQHALSASLVRPIADIHIRAAAAAWAAAITAHPLEAPGPAGQLLSSMAHLLQRGLQAATP